VLLDVQHLTKRFGGLTAVGDVSFALADGEILGIFGPNGSGKTTLLNAISGLIRLDAGAVALDGVEVAHLPAWRTARRGLGRTFQTPRVFEELSIWDNIRLGADFRGADCAQPHADGRAAGWLLDALEPERADWQAQRPDLLPHAQRRLLEVLRVIAMDVDVLLFDEPAAGLAPEERRSFAGLLRFLADRLGKTVLLVEHDLDLVWRVADRITVLDAGAIVADGAPDAIVADPRVRALFTGRRADA